MDNAARQQLIHETLTSSLNPSHLEVTDESHLHIGHPGAKTGMGHFAVKIACAKFDDKSMVQQHRLIYTALGELMQTDIHALRITIVKNKAP
jgi:BolA protein